VSAALVREGGECIPFFMLALGNARSKTCGIGKENQCAGCLSGDLSIDLSIASRREYGGNKYRRGMKNKKEG